MSIPKKFIISSLTFCLLSAPAWAQGISVELDGRQLSFDQPPAMMGGRLLVPLRGIFEALKADVVYDGATRSIQATKGSRVVQLQLGSRTAVIDGRTLFLDVPADTIGGRTMVPLRFVSEALGADVKWEGATKTVRLSSTGGQETADPGNNNTDNNPSESAAGPKIDTVFHNGTTVLQPGKTLDVIVYGEPGGNATFEILGVTSQIALPEVSSGKYQTRWVIPNGMVVEKGVLLAHLKKNGRETAVEAPRQITVVAGSNSTANPTGWAVTPNDGAVIAESQPQLNLTFPNAVQPATIRLFVDGIDFTNQARLSGNQLSWQPGYNLSQAEHKVQVQATSMQGQSLAYNWAFRIDPNASNQNSQVFSVSELRPNSGSTVAPRPQIGALFNRNLRSLTFYVDNTIITNQAGVQRLNNGILWTPNYDLSAGQHRARIQAVDQNGQAVNQDWNFTVQANSISEFKLSTNQASAGQTVTVSLNGPSGATGTFAIGNSGNYALREVSSGRYEGVYTVRTSDQGTAPVSAQLRTQSGQVLQANAPSSLTFTSQSNLSVSNLSNGMTISPVFNVQGSGQPGRTVSVAVEYSASNILGQIAGQMRRINTSGVVSASGHFDIPVDASAIRSGQQFRVTVSDGQSQPVQLTMTRQ